MRSCVFLVGNGTFAVIGLGAHGWAAGIAWVLRSGRAGAQNERSLPARHSGRTRAVFMAALGIGVWTVLVLVWLNGYVILGGLLDPMEIGCNLLQETVCNWGPYPFGHLAVYATALVWAIGVLGIYLSLPVWRRVKNAIQAW